MRMGQESILLFIKFIYHIVGNKPSDANSSEERQVASKWLKTRRRPDEDSAGNSRGVPDRVSLFSQVQSCLACSSLCCYNWRWRVIYTDSLTNCLLESFSSGRHWWEFAGQKREDVIFFPVLTSYLAVVVEAVCMVPTARKPWPRLQQWPLSCMGSWFLALVACFQVSLSFTYSHEIWQHHFSFSLPVLGLVLSSKQSSIIEHPCILPPSSFFLVSPALQKPLLSIAWWNSSCSIYLECFLFLLLVTYWQTPEKDTYSSDDCCSVTQSCLTLCDPMDCSLPDSSVHGTSKARILEWVAISFSRGSFRHRDWTGVSSIAGRFLITEPAGKPAQMIVCVKITACRVTKGKQEASSWMGLWVTLTVR